MKSEKKIRKLLLNDKYHFHHNLTTREWSLFRKYDSWDAYISESNKPIMTSKTHSEEELLAFIKERRTYSLLEGAENLSRILGLGVIVFLVLGIVNMKFSAIALGMSISSLIATLYLCKLNLINQKSNFKTRQDEMKRIIKRKIHDRRDDE